MYCCALRLKCVDGAAQILVRVRVTLAGAMIFEVRSMMNAVPYEGQIHSSIGVFLCYLLKMTRKT